MVLLPLVLLLYGLPILVVLLSLSEVEVPGTKLPAGVKFVSGYGQWAGPDPSLKSNILDVWGVGSDGIIYHYWLRNDTGKWYGYEIFG